MRSLRSAFFLAVPVLIAVACGGSTKTHGQLMVVIDTDLSVPKDIDTIGLVVSANGGVLYNQESAAGAADLKLPATIGVIEGSSPGESVTIRVLGRQSGNLVVLSEVITTVPDGRLALLRMPLKWLCQGQATDGSSDDLSEKDSTATSTCGGTQSCVAGSCVSEVVDSTTLPDFDPTQVFGGASGPGTSGQCFDTLGCFSSGYVTTVDTGDCTMPAPSGGTGVNVSLVLPPGGEGICGGQACLVPLDQAATDGWSDLGNGRIQLPSAVCTLVTSHKIEGVAVTTSCATKTPAIPTCGAWNSSSANVGTTDAGAPDGALAGHGGDAGPAPSDGGTAPLDSGSVQDAGQTCPTFTIDQSACDVIANTGCAKTQECSVNATMGASECVTIGSVAIGGACAVGGSASTSCAPGLYCSGGFCAPFCCNNEDCPVDAGFLACAQNGAGDGGTTFFGVCNSL